MMIPTTKIKQARMITFKSGDPGIRIDFPYRPETVEFVRTLEDRRWHPDRKCWTAAITDRNLERLAESDFTLDDKLNNLLREHQQRQSIHVNDMEASLKIKGLQKELYPFQSSGVTFIERNKGRTLIGDEMGLGKTIQALAWLQLRQEARPVVIVVPASAKLNWRKEARDWMTDTKCVIISGRETYPLPDGNIYIINYDILPSWVSVLRAIQPKVLITDECHFYKNNKAKRTKAVKQLAKGIPYVLALSGTPIVNRPAEIYNAVRIIDPMVLPDFWNFARRYCGLRHNGFGWDWSGATNTKELHKILVNSVMIRRLKEEVLPDLPKKTRSFVPMELDNRSTYDYAEEDFIDWLREQKGMKAAERASRAEYMVRANALKKLAAEGKLNSVVGWIKDFFETENKLVVFAHHRDVVSRLMEEFGSIAVKIDGSMSSEKKHEAQERFQKDPKIKLLVGNLQAAGIAITLTAASTVAFIELPWRPGDLVQAEDRVHRIGQQEKVIIYYLLAEDSIDEHTAQILDHKARVLVQVLDGKAIGEEDTLTELINKYLES